MRRHTFATGTDATSGIVSKLTIDAAGRPSGMTLLLLTPIFTNQASTSSLHQTKSARANENDPRVFRIGIQGQTEAAARFLGSDQPLYILRMNPQA